VSADREAAVTAAFVSLASSLVTGDDVADLLDTLTTDCVRLLDVASAGLLLADARGVLHVLAASSPATRALELFQLQRDQGPCRDCFHSGRPVAVPDLAALTSRWPLFVPRARAAGVASVHAFPMRLRDATLGALGLFGSGVGSLDAADSGLAQALADVASVALVQHTAAADPSAITSQLQTALAGRAAIERAKGLLAQLGGIDMDQALAALRRHARTNSRRLTDVADAVVSRTLAARVVLEGVAGAGGLADAPGGRGGDARVD